MCKNISAPSISPPLGPGNILEIARVAIDRGNIYIETIVILEIARVAIDRGNIYIETIVILERGILKRCGDKLGTTIKEGA